MPKLFNVSYPVVSLRLVECNENVERRLEGLLFKLEVLDHKARERAGVITPTLGSPIPVLLQMDAAMEVMLLIL